MSKHKERIGRLVAWLRQQEDMRPPLIAFRGGHLIADTPSEVIEAALAEGRRVAWVRFVKPTAPGLAPDDEKPSPARVLPDAEVMSTAAL